MDEKYFDLHKELRSRVERLEAQHQTLDIAGMSARAARPESSFFSDKKLIADYRARLSELESRIATKERECEQWAKVHRLLVQLI